MPTLKELGYDLTYYLWIGLFAPKGTPAAIVTTLTGAIDKAAATPAVHRRDRQDRPRTELPQRGRFHEVLGRGRQAVDDAVHSIGKVAG